MRNFRLGAAFAAVLVLAMVGGAHAAPDRDPSGKPKGFDKGDYAKYGLWKGQGGWWHVMWTTHGGTHEFSGVINLEGGVFGPVKRHNLEALQDWVVVGPKRHTVRWKTKTAGGMDGFSFKMEGVEALNVDMKIDGKSRAKRVFVGREGFNPKTLPIRVTKPGSYAGDGGGDGAYAEPAKPAPAPAPKPAPKPAPEKYAGGDDGGGGKWDPTGRPATLDKGDVVKYGVWKKGEWWHVAWTTAGNSHAMNGSVKVAGGKITEVKRHNLEALQDWVIVGPKRHGLRFKTTTAGGIDGFAFKVGPRVESITLDLKIDGNHMPKRIFVGKAGHHPKNVPMTINKPSKW